MDDGFAVRPDKITKYNKVLFVVDKSGSNATVNGLGNDPNNIKRADSIEIFLNKKRDDPFYKWGYIVFGVDQNKSQAWINEDGNLSQGKFGTPEEMDQALRLQRGVPDNGCTPYLGGLQLAKITIQKDLEDHPDEDSVYNVFFMSDGFPNDANSAQGCASTTTVSDNPNDPYIKAVTDLRSLSPDKIFLSAAYYAEAANDPGRRAAEGLSFMAKAGGGNFVDLRGNGTINFDAIQTGSLPIPLRIKRMFVVNLNSGFCDDGTVDVDSDADGICDKDELAYNSKFSARLAAMGKSGGFDPANRNSLDGSYSDLFTYMYRVVPNGVGLPDCINADSDVDFDLLNTCEEFVMQDTTANGPTPQWTLAMPKGGTEVKNPDSDGDGFLDGLEWLTFGIRSSPVNYQSLFQPFAGGLTGEQIIREHRNPKNPQVYGSGQYDGNLVYTGLDVDGNHTYRYDQRQLALYRTLAVGQNKVSGMPHLAHEADENVILAYYIAVPDNEPNGRGTLYYSFHKLNYKDASLSKTLKFDNMKSYQVPRLNQ